MTTITRYITGRMALVLGAVLLLGYAFLASGATDGFTFATNTTQGKPLELKIDAKTFYNGLLQPQRTWNLKNLVPGVDKFWNFDDVKPGDTGTSSISIHIKNGPAYACLDFYNYKDLENGVNEPESHVDTSSTTGELGTGLEFFAWKEGDGDRVFEPAEAPLFGTTSQSAVQVLNNTTYAIADALHGNPIQNGVVKYVGVYWCAGDLEVNLATGKATCNGEVLGNEAQTDSMGVDVAIRAVSSQSQPKFTCSGVPPPVQWCEFEGHKYDEKGAPLQGWDIGLMKKITHNKGVDVYALATSTTDQNGYFCLDWNGEKRTPINTPTYKSGPYTHEYFVYEVMKKDWKNVAIEKGATYHVLTPVPSGQIIKDGVYVMISMGSGYIASNVGYHVDFYNTKTKSTSYKTKGNNGHGNDDDGNDNSNPGASNDIDDHTDDDGLPPGFTKKHGENYEYASWNAVGTKKVNVTGRMGDMYRSVIKKFRS